MKAKCINVWETMFSKTESHLLITKHCFEEENPIAKKNNNSTN